jgi:O-antigen ligase
MNSTQLANRSTAFDGRGGADGVARAIPVSSLTFGTYIVYTLFFFLNIPNRYPFLGVVRPTVLLAVLMTVLLLVQKKGVRKDVSATPKILIAFIVYSLVSLPFTEWPGSVLRVHLQEFIKVVVFFFFTVQAVDTPERLKRFVAVVVGTQVVRALEPLYLHLKDGYWGSNTYIGDGEFMRRLSGAPADIINPNGLAFVVITALPFLYYLCFNSKSRFLKVLFVALAPALVWALLLTGSRSGLIGLGVVLLAIVWKSRHKTTFIVLIVISAVLVTPFLSSDMRDRYFSIVDTNTENGGTVQGRIDGLWVNLYEGLERPIFGHGLGTSKETAYNFNRGTHVAHNLYLEAFIETGIIGLAIYCVFLFSILKNYRRAMEASARLASRRSEPLADYYLRLSDAVRAFAIMCLVFSISQYGVREFHWYLVGGLSVVLARLATDLAEQQGIKIEAAAAKAPVDQPSRS